VTRWQANEAERFLRRTLTTGDGQRQLFCVLTPGSDREGLPAFLRNLRPLELGPGVARELHDLITVAPWSDDREALRDAASALRNLPTRVANSGRLALIGETVAGMTGALNSGDLAALHELSVDLELLSKIRTHAHAVALPADLAAEARALLERIDRRIAAYTV
jgi:hypothetical protein